MESLLRAWDGENVILRFDQLTKSWIIIAIHSTRLGPAVGGTRMKPYADATAALRDAMRLAEGMTHNGWTLEIIESDKAAFSRDGEITELNLEVQTGRHR